MTAATFPIICHRSAGTSPLGLRIACMTDAEKIALIETALHDLIALRAHFERTGRPKAIPPAHAHTLTKISEILGTPDIF